jgi:hypothetical protein
VKIDVFRDGRLIGVSIGPNVTDGFSGYGLDLPAALAGLILDLRSDPDPSETPERAQLRRELRSLSAR